MARIPDRIGKYHVVERIGKGGMGTVYKAEHPTLGRHVILKKLTIAGDQAVRERFRREAEIMIDFRTDYVVDVYDHFRDGANDYIVLEYIDGLSLEELLLRERYLRSDLALFVIRDCLRGLEYVHRKGVVHRDVKPGNVVIARDGSVKLLDFGVASRVTGFDEELTQEGMTLGTVAYIAPEQIEQSRSVDRRADIYSTGATLYETVTGRKPFTGGFTPETVNRIQRGKYRRPRRVNPRVSRTAARLVRRCMHRKPSRRYQSAADAVRELDAYFRGRDEDELRGRLAVLAGGSAAEDERPARRRFRWGVAAAAAAVVLALSFASGWVAGVVQPFVVGGSHALVRYELRLRKTGRTVGEHRIRLGLERETDGSLAGVPVRLPLLRPVAALETPDYLVLRSRPLTVPAGRYASSVRIEQATVREIVSVEPLHVDPGTRVLAAQWDPPEPDAVDVAVEVRDAYSGDAVEGYVLETLADGEWVRVERGVGGWRRAVEPASVEVGLLVQGDGDLLSRIVDARRRRPEPVGFVPGETVVFRARHDDYLSERVDLETDAYSRSARVRVALVPAPASLLINSTVDEATLLVDDSGRVPAAGRLPTLVDLPRVYPGVTELSLRPGYHRVELRAGNRSDAEQVRLPPGGGAVLRLESADDRLDLSVVEVFQ